MSRLTMKKDRPVSGAFSTSSISRPMPLRPAANHTARHDTHRHRHARSASAVVPGLAGHASSSQPSHAHAGLGALSTSHSGSRTSLSDWEVVDHGQASSGSRSRLPKPPEDDHNHTQHRVRHVGSLHHPTGKAHSDRRSGGDDDNELEDFFEDGENKEWRSTIERFDRQDVRMSMLFTDAEYGQEVLFNIFPELSRTTKRTPLVPMPVWDKDIKASKLLAPVMDRQRQILIKLGSDVDADVLYHEELEKNIKRGLTVSRASRHAAEKVMRVVDGLVAAKVEEINAIERRKAEYQEHLRMFEGEVFPASHVRRVGPSSREPCLNTNVPRQRHARSSSVRQEPVASTSRASTQLR